MLLEMFLQQTMIKSTEAYAYKKQDQMALTLQPLNLWF